ncbi:MAG: N-acetylmuramoyl-L-alanine amidase [Pseudomonadota bacterium]
MPRQVPRQEPPDTQHRSPNHTERRGVDPPDMVVLHYTGMESCDAAIARLCDPAAEVSAHYVVDIDGTTFALVDEHERAWHAGRSSWGGVVDVNSHSIGIEIVNPGHGLGYPPFPEPQMQAVEIRLTLIMERWSIPPERVVGHACIAPGRKIDPGEKFDWRRLAQRGLAVWLDPLIEDNSAPDATGQSDLFRAAAERIGYAVPDQSEWSPELLDVWQAFAMRFLPGQAGREPSATGVAHAKRIAERWPCIDPALANT